MTTTPSTRGPARPRTARRTAPAAAVALAATLAAIGGLAPVAAAKETSRIAYVCLYDICSVGQDGRTPRTITRDGTLAAPYVAPSLSRAGDRLAVVRGGAVLTGRTGGTLSVAATNGDGVASVAMRPDGRAFVFGYQGSLAEPERPTCSVSTVDGFSTTCDAIIPGQALRPRVEAPGVILDGASPSYLGSDALVVSRGSAPQGTDDGGRSVGGCVLRPPFSGTVACASTAVPPDSPTDKGQRALVTPTGSPDGATFAGVVLNLDLSDDAGALNLYDAASGRLVRQLAPLASDPAFSPDGTQVAYALPTGAIMVVPTAGGPARQVASKGSDPTWGGAATVPTSLSLRRLRQGRLRVQGVRCARRCTVRASITISAATARALRIRGSRTIATGTMRRSRSGTPTIVVQPRSGVASRLKRTTSADATLRTSGSGRRTTASIVLRD